MFRVRILNFPDLYNLIIIKYTCLNMFALKKNSYTLAFYYVNYFQLSVSYNFLTFLYVGINIKICVFLYFHMGSSQFTFYIQSNLNIFQYTFSFSSPGLERHYFNFYQLEGIDKNNCKISMRSENIRNIKIYIS